MRFRSEVRSGVRAVLITAVLAGLVGCGAEPFEPQGEEATAARQRAWGEVDRAVADVRGDSEPIAEARFDGCHNGQNNWKIQDKYAHECSVAASVLVRAADREDGVSDALQALSARFDELGCTTTWYPLAEIDRRYWQAFRDRPDYSPGSLPEARYDCAGVTVTADPVDAATIRAGLHPTAALGLDELLDERPYPEDTATLAASAEVALIWMFTADSRYYATEF